MTNRLADTLSPYLRAHADNPVDWYPWGPEAFAEAQRRDVPLLISIGYSTCHWCHVMARESFADPRRPRSINDDFVAVKVDREEHPDVDGAYMAAASRVHAEPRLAADGVHDAARTHVLRRHVLAAGGAAADARRSATCSPRCSEAWTAAPRRRPRSRRMP